MFDSALILLQPSIVISTSFAICFLFGFYENVRIDSFIKATFSLTDVEANQTVKTVFTIGFNGVVCDGFGGCNCGVMLANLVNM